MRCKAFCLILLCFLVVPGLSAGPLATSWLTSLRQLCPRVSTGAVECLSRYGRLILFGRRRHQEGNFVAAKDCSKAPSHISKKDLPGWYPLAGWEACAVDVPPTFRFEPAAVRVAAMLECGDWASVAFFKHYVFVTGLDSDVSTVQRLLDCDGEVQRPKVKFLLDIGLVLPDGTIPYDVLEFIDQLPEFGSVKIWTEPVEE
jgi:hypothetical protein